MSADSFLGIYKRGNEFIAQSCWSECPRNHCASCATARPPEFIAYSLDEAITLAEQERRTENYEYGYSFLNLPTGDMDLLMERKRAKELPIKKFWICYVERTGGGKHYRHYSCEKAENEAERLAKLIGKKVYLLECVGQCTAEKVRWEIPR